MVTGGAVIHPALQLPARMAVAVCRQKAASTQRKPHSDPGCSKKGGGDQRNQLPPPRLSLVQL